MVGIQFAAVVGCGLLLPSVLFGCGGGGENANTLHDLKDCVVEEEQHPAEKAMPNVGFVGYGYHIYQANPKEKGGVDPGFKQPIFQLQYAKQRKTADGRYNVPDGTNAISTSACETSRQTTKMMGTKSYSESLSTSIEGSVGYGPFSASAGYSTVAESTSSSSDRSLFVEASARCSVYKVSIQTSNAPQVTRNFANAVAALPRVYSNETAAQFFEFLDEWGSHAVMAVEMGGLWGYRSEFKEHSYATMIKSGTSVSAGASASFLVDASLEVKTDEEKQEAESFKNSRKDVSIFNIGGKYSEDSTEWIANVKAEPMPIKSSLKDLSDLMDSKYMQGCNAESLAAARRSFKSALNDYCLEHAAKKWPGVQCTALADDPPPPLVRSNFIDSATGGDWSSVDRIETAVECPSGTWVTNLDWWYNSGSCDSCVDYVGMANGRVTCSDGTQTTIGTSDDTHAGGTLNTPTKCDAGLSQLRFADKSCSGLVAGEYKCAQSDTTNSMTGEALVKDASYKPWVQCPEDMPVLVGVQDRYCSCFSKHCGLDRLGLKCGNDNEVSGTAASTAGAALAYHLAGMNGTQINVV